MKKLFKFILTLIILLIILCLAAYFAATNSFVIKNVILPVVGGQLNAKISVEKVVLSPFAGNFMLKDFRMTAQDQYSVKIGDFDCNLNLFDLVKGKLNVAHLKLIDSDIRIIQNVSKKEQAVAKTKTKKPVSRGGNTVSKPMLLDINNVKIKNFNLEYIIKRSTESKTSITEIKDFNLMLPQLKTGSDGTVDYNGTFRIGSAVKEHSSTGSFSGQIYTKLSGSSMPVLLKLTSKAKFGDEVTPIDIQFASSENQKMHTQPFKVNAEITNFPLLPLFKAFVEGSLSGSQGNVENLSLTMQGNDLTNFDVYHNVSGQLKTDIKNLSLPMQLTQYDTMKLMFLPVEILANINQYTKSNIVPPQLDNAFKSTKDITSGLSEMRFDQGNVDLSLNKGVVKINKFQMKGGEANTVRSLSFQGVNDLNNQIDIKTKTDLLGLVLPIRIRGTVNSPKPDLSMLLPGVVFGSVEDIVSTGADVIGKNIPKEGKQVIDSILKPQQTTDKKSKGEKLLDSAGKLLNNFLK